jgi:hypothetical protein
VRNAEKPPGHRPRPCSGGRVRQAPSNIQIVPRPARNGRRSISAIVLRNCARSDALPAQRNSLDPLAPSLVGARAGTACPLLRDAWRSRNAARSSRRARTVAVHHPVRPVWRVDPRTDARTCSRAPSERSLQDRRFAMELRTGAEACVGVRDPRPGAARAVAPTASVHAGVQDLSDQLGMARETTSHHRTRERDLRSVLHGPGTSRPSSDLRTPFQ